MPKPEVQTRSQGRRLRRKRLRTQHLADLVYENPAAFTRTWNWLLEGWVREIKRRVPLLIEKDGGWTPSTAALIADVKNMLESIGDRATAAEMTGTLATLNETQMHALAKEVEKRLAPKQWATRVQAHGRSGT